MTLNAKVMERAVLDYLGTLWHARQPGQPSNENVPSSYWGYVLSMGSTEGNLFGLWSARDYLAGRALYRKAGGEVACVEAPTLQEEPNAYRPVAFYSEDTHYSVIKVLCTLAINSFHQLGEAEYPGQCPFNGGRWPLAVPSQGGDWGPGAIDIGKLAALVAFFAEKGHPIIVVLNYGTTFKGAYDDVRAAGEALEPILRKHGLFERKVAYEFRPLRAAHRLLDPYRCGARRNLYALPQDGQGEGAVQGFRTGFRLRATLCAFDYDEWPQMDWCSGPLRCLHDAAQVPAHAAGRSRIYRRARHDFRRFAQRPRSCDPLVLLRPDLL